MKKNIHPQYFTVEATCSTCGKKFQFGSTKKSISVDVCSGCHVVYTGDRTKTKATGMIDKFNQRLAKQKAAIEKSKGKKK
ncbi:50S ribosomal protein L31 [Mycoplasmopsis fermentans]|uniref:50S ribosomal protein L31 n=2 Tax=Mycoplasmopsis fermentans TaxID=2115 RepID=C4XES6_MYCFP|nr:50S ribosomal protein L31 [Mycoplasmopsis fermentans]VEU67513.1 50S ribosomal protein L31 [Mesomycoplasma conjunctivae]ADN68925.1 50S ribosomal protein L31 [Mycoplasmopsis fermentans JER]ADV34348.1 50S ribosomal protein L31 [Mycoplasmopsis fermentans M64]RMX35835.1 ribosomal protein L31 [Mycoplasmopsis fermentans MF-I2]RMX35898.1 ribosomal protein L31 [Mycoplasmopsis fermentans MF-I1]